MYKLSKINYRKSFRNLKSFTWMFLVLFSMWMMWSGKTDAEFIEYGIFSCLASIALFYFLSHFADYKSSFTIKIRRIITYIPWIIYQMIMSSIAMTKIIWSRNPPISPIFIRISVPYMNDFAYAMFANSITITPGTISVVTHPNYIEIHAITKENAEDLLSDEFLNRARSVFDG